MLKFVFTFAAMVVVLALAVARWAPDLALSAAKPAAEPSAAPAPMKSARAGTAQVRADRSGHFVSDIEVQGRSLRAVIDTGATAVALRYEDARDLGLIRHERFDREVSTANGMARGMLVRLNDVRVGDVVVYDVEALVLQPGALSTNLLGMSFLRRLSRFEVRSDVVVLEQ